MVTLSGEELNTLQDVGFLRAKQSATQKLIELLAATERDLHKAIHSSGFHFPVNTFIQSGKISKGENYRGLPYLVLDYPRLFTQQEVFAFRSIVWWGNELSCSMHLSGDALLPYKNLISKRLSGVDDLFVCVNASPWEFHFGRDNFLPAMELSERDLESYLEQYGFIKFATKISLAHPDSFNSFILKSFARFLKYLDPS